MGNRDEVVVKYLVRGGKVVNGVLQEREVGFEEIVLGRAAKRMAATGTVKIICLVKDMEALG